MADWVEANPVGAPTCSTALAPNTPCSYPNYTATLSYATQVLPSAACQMTPAQRGITSWLPGIAAGYVPPFAAALDVNKPGAAGWPFPCDFIPAWAVGALAAGARPPAGDTLSGDKTNGTAIFGEVDLKLGQQFNLTLGYRHHKQAQDQFSFDLPASIRAGVTADKPPGPNMEFTSGNIYDGIRLPGVTTWLSTPIPIACRAAGTSPTASCSTSATPRASTRAAWPCTTTAWERWMRHTTQRESRQP